MVCPIHVSNFTGDVCIGSFKLNTGVNAILFMFTLIIITIVTCSYLESRNDAKLGEQVK